MNVDLHSETSWMVPLVFIDIPIQSRSISLFPAGEPGVAGETAAGGSARVHVPGRRLCGRRRRRRFQEPLQPQPAAGQHRRRAVERWPRAAHRHAAAQEHRRQTVGHEERPAVHAAPLQVRSSSVRFHSGRALFALRHGFRVDVTRSGIAVFPPSVPE